MQQHEIEKIIYGAIAKQFKVNEADIRPDWSLVEDLGADSYALIELMVNLEEAFQSGVPDALEIKTVGDITNLVKNELEKVEKA